MSDISKFVGGDCTASAVDNRLRYYKTDAKLMAAAVARGEDPMDLNIPSGHKCTALLLQIPSSAKLLHIAGPPSCFELLDTKIVI